MNRSTWVAIVALLILALAAAPLLGWWTLAVPALALPLVLALGRAPRNSGAWGAAAVALGLLGGGIGVMNAAAALLEVGGEAPYSGRAGFGWAALALAALATAGGSLARSRRAAAAGLLILGSTAGTVAMGLFWLNSWYAASLPLCWLAAALALLQPPGGAPASRPQPGDAGDGRPSRGGERADTFPQRQARRPGSTIKGGTPR